MTGISDTAPRKRGQKGKYNPERVKAITDALRLGVTVEDACEYADISAETFYKWLREKTDFAEAVKKAFASATLALVGRIRKEADEGTWQAAAWLLERRHPERWGRRVVQQSGGVDITSGGQKLEIVLREVTADDDDHA
jgi:transposase-like protein